MRLDHTLRYPSFGDGLMHSSGIKRNRFSLDNRYLAVALLISVVISGKEVS
jgi:hypothetical protein